MGKEDPGKGEVRARESREGGGRRGKEERGEEGGWVYVRGEWGEGRGESKSEGRGTGGERVSECVRFQLDCLASGSRGGRRT